MPGEADAVAPPVIPTRFPLGKPAVIPVDSATRAVTVSPGEHLSAHPPKERAGNLCAQPDAGSGAGFGGVEGMEPGRGGGWISCYLDIEGPRLDPLAGYALVAECVSHG